MAAALTSAPSRAYLHPPELRQRANYDMLLLVLLLLLPVLPAAADVTEKHMIFVATTGSGSSTTEDPDGVNPFGKGSTQPAG